MITLALAGVKVGIDNQYDIEERLRDWIVPGPPDFTVRAGAEELLREDAGRGLRPDYLEFICVYRHIAERLPEYGAFVFHGAAIVMEELAYLFTAPSGTGKTTHAQLWRYGFEGRAWFLNGDKPFSGRPGRASRSAAPPGGGRRATASTRSGPSRASACCGGGRKTASPRPDRRSWRASWPGRSTFPGIPPGLCGCWSCWTPAAAASPPGAWNAPSTAGPPRSPGRPCGPDKKSDALQRVRFFLLMSSPRK